MTCSSFFTTRKTNSLFAVICALLISTKSFAYLITPLEHTLRKYHDSGMYHDELSKVAARADKYITQQATLNQQSGHPQKLAIVLDVDETSLSYYNHMLKHHFWHNPADARKEILTASAPPIKPILSLYDHAIQHDIAVFFVTARRSFAYQATVKNLKSAGYKTWAGVYTRP